MLLAQASASRNGEFDQPLRRALDFWLSNDFEASDWRQNQLIVPQQIGSIAVLFEENLSPGARGKVMEILARSRWHHWVPQSGWTEWSGTHLLQIAHNIVLRGCLDNSPTAFDEAFKRVFGAIRIAPDGEVGIQPDMIYHASNAGPQGVDEGLSYATDCARFVALAHGTPWQAPVEVTTLLATFLLNGQQWLMRNGMIDSTSSGRATGPDTVDRETLAAVVERLAQFADTPRRMELAALARRLAGKGDTLAGHRYFWRSGFSVHQRPSYYTSVRLAPSRTSAPEEVSTTRGGEGIISIMRSGHEYDSTSSPTANICLPGTTFPFPAVEPVDEPGARKTPLLVGGVSEGDYGLAALQCEREGVTAVKSWYYFDHSFVCLGAGINAWDTDGAVFTSVNRCRLSGPVVTQVGTEPPRILDRATDHDLRGVQRVVHDGIVYEFAQRADLRVQLSPPEHAVPELFTLWIAHGTQVRDQTYACIVLPSGSDGSPDARIDEEISQVEILANTPGLQAVRHRGLRLIGITFWQAGLVVLPDGGRVAANQPCVLLCRETPSVGKRLSIANLRSEPTTVHVEYAGRSLGFELPGGPDAGRGINRSL